MSDQNASFNHRDLAAIALLCWVIFLAVSLATYNAADAVGPLAAPFDQLYHPDVTVSPQNETIANQCGWWGAFTAELLFSSFGYAAYYVVGALAVVDIQLLRRREIDSTFTRTAGWGLSLLGLAGVASLLFPHATPGPVLGSGGALGSLIGWGLETHFATTGGVILCVSSIVAGLMMCTDYAVFRAASLARVAVVGTVASGRNIVKRSAERRSATFVPTDVEDGIDLGDDDEEVEEARAPIRIRGLVNELEDELEEEDGEWSEYDSDEEQLEEAEEDEYEEDAELEEEWDEEEEAEDEEQEIVVKTPNKKKKRESHNSESAERDEVFAELNDIDYEEDDDYELPSLELLISGDDVNYDSQRKELAHKARLLEKTFNDFGFNVKVVEIETGPVIAQYEIELEAGLRLSKITNLADDLAIALRVPSVRIVAPIPGKNTVGIEVPNAKRQVVRLRDVIEETNGAAKKMKIPLFLGQDVSGNPMTADLASLPHLLIAGRTGTGKSVCLNAIISSILMTKRPDEVRMLMIDPKMVELSGYGRLPHLMHPVVTDMKKAEAILAWAVDKMEERYSLLAKAGVRHITSYNQLGEEELMDRLGVESDEERAEIPQHIPFIVIVADEMADLMMTAGKEVEQHIIRLAQKSRAVGIHLILATQKPTVDVITGLIKSNLPARISFQVASRTDSRVVLDEMGAEKLLGNGDMLFLWPGTSTLLRGQGTYLSDEEIQGVTDSVSTGEQNFVNELVNMNVAEADGDRMEELRKRDELYESAIEVVVREQRGSCSLLQRSLGIGYGRAARLIDFMAEDGIVGNYAGSQAREVMIQMEDWERMQGLTPSEDESAAPPPKAPAGEAKKGAKPKAPPKLKKPAAEDAADDPTPLQRVDSPSEHKPARTTAESAVNRPKKRLRRNRIVLGPQDDAAWDDDETSATLMTLAPEENSADDVIDLDDLLDDVVEGQVVAPAEHGSGPETLQDDELVEELEDEELEDEEALYEEDEVDEEIAELEDDEEEDEEDEEDEVDEEIAELEDDEEEDEEDEEDEEVAELEEEEEEEWEEEEYDEEDEEVVAEAGELDEEEEEEDEEYEEEEDELEEEVDEVAAELEESELEDEDEGEEFEEEDEEGEYEEEEEEEVAAEFEEEEEEEEDEDDAQEEEEEEEYEYDESAYADDLEYEEEEEEEEEDEDTYTAESA